MENYLSLVVVAMTVVILLLFVASKVVPVGHVFLIERLGRYRTSLTPGLHLTIPVIDTVRAKINVGEQTLIRTGEPLLTSDNHVIPTDAVVHYQITDPRAAVYEVDDYVRAIDQLTVATLRDLMGAMDPPTALVSADVMGAELRRVLSWTTTKWGVRVNRAEITAMAPPVRY